MTGDVVPDGKAVHSSRDFAERAKSFGYEYRSFSPTTAPADDDAGLFAGSVQTFSFPSGLKVCASDLTALKDSAHDGCVERSLTLAVGLEGVAGECDFGRRGKLAFGPGCAAMVATAEATQLASRVRAGERSRCLLLRAKPEDLVDEDLAARVDAALRATAARQFPLSARTHMLANELFAPRLSDGAGRLLAESCALELLARSPLLEDEREDRLPGALTRRDHARMATVREALLTEPDREHRLCDLARLAGVSVTVLKTKFAIAFGQPVFAFLRDVRLERARSGLEEEGWTVAQAAYHSGYQHPTSFTFAFRQRYGIAPSAVRRR